MVDAFRSEMFYLPELIVSYLFNCVNCHSVGFRLQFLARILHDQLYPSMVVQAAG